MDKLYFAEVTEKNRDVFHRLMLDYAKELDEQQQRVTEQKTLEKWTDSVIEKGSNDGRYLKLCYAEGKAVGFVYGKVDSSSDMGYKKPGYGYVMEFYVIPDCRRKGYGRKMFRRLERFFECGGVKRMYLTAAPVIGKLFWEAIGFACTGEISPENGLEFYEKSLTPEQVSVYVEGETSFEKKPEMFSAVQAVSSDDARFAGIIYGQNIAALHGNEINFEDFCSILSCGDNDERHFLILKGAVPCAYLKINGLESDGAGWISLLAVKPVFKRRGAGEYAVKYAEKFMRSMGKTEVRIHTTNDNIPARGLYEKCGYSISEHITYVTGDGVKRQGLTYSKKI